MKRARASTMNVMTNRISPSAISDDGVEIADGLGELVGDRGRDGRAGREDRGRDLCALPITKVTAMVSPSARPRPSITPPITPTRV